MYSNKYPPDFRGHSKANSEYGNKTTPRIRPLAIRRHLNLLPVALPEYILLSGIILPFLSNVETPTQPNPVGTSYTLLTCHNHFDAGLNLWKRPQAISVAVLNSHPDDYVSIE